MMRYTIQPSFYDIDWMGIISNLSYVRWIEDIRSRLLDISPYPMNRLVEEKIFPAVFQTQINYIAPYIGIQGGLIEVQIIAGKKTGRSRWELDYNFYQKDTDLHLAHGFQSGCFVTLPEIKPARIPADIVEFLQIRLAPDTEYVLG